VLVAPATLHRLVRARELLAQTDAPLTSIASAVRLSPFHLIRQFSAVFGETPHRWRTRERLERAKQRLRGGATVTEACLAAGYVSLGSFSTLFAQWHGASPQRWRVLVSVPAQPPPVVPGCLGVLAQLPRSAAGAFRGML
jgi:AraC-like DNA-binding protein